MKPENEAKNRDVKNTCTQALCILKPHVHNIPNAYAHLANLDYSNPTVNVPAPLSRST